MTTVREEEIVAETAQLRGAATIEEHGLDPLEVDAARHGRFGLDGRPQGVGDAIDPGEEHHQQVRIELSCDGYFGYITRRVMATL